MSDTPVTMRINLLEVLGYEPDFDSRCYTKIKTIGDISQRGLSLSMDFIANRSESDFLTTVVLHEQDELTPSDEGYLRAVTGK